MHNNTMFETTPINTLIMKFSIPCIMSLLVSSLYNIVDQIFIGRGVGYLGNGATNVVFPITVIALAIALLVGDGAAAFLSLCQGQKEVEKGNKAVGNAIFILVVSSILLTVLFMFGRENILHAFGATSKTYPYAVDYFNVIVLGIPFYVIFNGLNSIIRADGSPQFAMASTLVGCIVNIILDPIAIFVFHMGVTGAAIATIIGQIVSFAFGAYYVFHAKTFTLSKHSVTPSWKSISHILPLGISSLLTQLSIVAIMGVMNSTLVHYGALSMYGAEIPMTVMGIVMKVFQIVIAFVVGVAAGCQPIVGYNYGAGKMDRVKELFKKMMMLEILIGVVAMLCFELFPLQIIGLFGSESDLYNQFAVMAFRIFLSTVTLCCLQKSISIFLQAVGKPVMSMFLSLLREFILSIPLVLILPNIFDLGVVGPLFSAPIADIVSVVVAAIMMMRFFSVSSTEESLAYEA